jgi:Glycosyltransferase 61
MRNILKFDWDCLKKALRIRHRIKTLLLSPFLLEQGKLRNYALSVTCFGRREHQEIPPTFVLEETGRCIQHPAKSNTFAKPCIIQLKRVRVLGPYSVPLIRTRLATENLGGIKQASLTLPVLRYILCRFKRLEASYDDVYFVNSPYCHNFYHWFFDCLMQLRQYEAYALRRPECKLMINAWNSWQRRSLEILGYEQGQYFPWQYEHGRVQNLFTSEWTHRQGTILRRGDLIWLRDRLLRSSYRSRTGDTNFSKLVFISRRDSPKVRLSNEGAIFERLSDIGFSAYTLSNMSLDDQIELFANAKMVVAAHGAGLTNIMYMDRGKLFEIHTEKFVDFFYNISYQLGLEYFSVLASKDSSGSFECDPELVAVMVRAALKMTPIQWSEKCRIRRRSA